MKPHSRLSGLLLEQYKGHPGELDQSVRLQCSIPRDRYYSVTLFPEDHAGEIFLTGGREVKAVKISKSP